MTSPGPARAFQPHVPNVARIYDALLGGKDNFPPDRAAAKELLALAPEVGEAVRANRAFLGKAVACLASAGHTQFLDIGSGLPTQRNVHEVAQEANPEARVVYVDNDKLVLTHGRALLRDEKVAMVAGDLRDPAAILNDPAVTTLLDLSRPVVVMLVAVLHFIDQRDHPDQIINTLRERLPQGSCLVVTHACADEMSPDDIAKGEAVYKRTGTPIVVRSHQEILSLLNGFTLHPPGLVEVSQWVELTDEPTPLKPDAAQFLGAIATLGADVFPLTRAQATGAAHPHIPHPRCDHATQVNAG